VTRVKALNVFLLQWVGFRLARVIEEDGEQSGWAIIGPVLPLTGWGNGYIGRPAPVISWRKRK
jgi:hypothetical protein